MKTTVSIPDPLLIAARKLAAEESTTLCALIEEGLRHVLDRRQRQGSFQLRRASFLGKGLQPEIVEGRWARTRALTYEGRGGR